MVMDEERIARERKELEERNQRLKKKKEHESSEKTEAIAKSQPVTDKQQQEEIKTKEPEQKVTPL
jgi:hypothetical protein